MKYTDEYKKFLKEYERYENEILKPTHDELVEIIKDWERPDYWKDYTTGKGVATPFPIRMTTVRIKHPEKAVDKIFRKSGNFPEGLSPKSIYNMHDALGVRLIVYFSSQLPLIDKEIRSSNMFNISKESPPKAYYEKDILDRLGLSHISRKYKESGYSSIHYTVRLKKSTIPVKKRPYFEIQVRTLAQELWCELEHVLSYKSENRTDLSAKRRFQILSREIGVIDEHFNQLYEDLIHNQEIASYNNSDTLTFENLPKVLSEIGVQCALTDLKSILKILLSRDIKTIDDLLKIANPRRLTTIRNTYISTTGHAPDNLELISALAMLKGAQTKEIEAERIKSQIDYSLSNIFKKKTYLISR